jgi:hypothetical protein
MVDVEVVEPDDTFDLDEEEQECVQFLTTGGLRCQIRGVWYRLKRPDLGELRELHESYEAIADELAPFAEEQARLSRDLQAKLTSIRTKADALAESPSPQADTEALAAELVQVQRQQKKALLEVQNRALGMREQWWREVFKTLKVKGNPNPKVPAQMPTWVGDQDMGVKVIEHWMRVPLGRGK